MSQHPASMGNSSVRVNLDSDPSAHPASIKSQVSPREHEAAVKIQKVVRGHLSRRNSEQQLRSGNSSPSISAPSSPRGKSSKKQSIKSFFANLSPVAYVVGGLVVAAAIGFFVYDQQSNKTVSRTTLFSTRAPAPVVTRTL